MDTVGIIGAGNIGTSLAHSLIIHNKKIVLVDVSEVALEESSAEIEKLLKFTHMYLNEKDRYRTELIQNVKFTKSVEDIASCDFVVENITENWDEKKNLYRDIDRICDNSIIFGVNTSCISITKIGALTDRADKVIGIHFMNPVFLKPCVEVIRGYYTSDETLDNVNCFLNELNMHSVVVRDFPGFVSNRISHLFMNEAVFTLQDSVAKPEEIDKIFRECFGHKMGPLETIDLIGLDTVYNSLIVLYESYKDSKYRPAPLLEKMVNAGLLGTKTGQGFYKH